MSALENNPPTVNILPQVDFSLKIKRCPSVEFFVQKANLPGIHAESVPIPTPLATIKKNYDHLTFNNLNITFKVDEKLQNYLEIHNWMRALGPTIDFTGYDRLNKNGPTSGHGLFSEMTLMILDSNKKPKYEVVFENAFPIDLSDLTFASDLNQVYYNTASVSFDYTLYRIKVI